MRCTPAKPPRGDSIAHLYGKRQFPLPDFLALDDLFLARRIADVSSELLQNIVHQRYKLRRTIVITSNRVVQDWDKYLGDTTMATTIVDHLMHRQAML